MLYQIGALTLDTFPFEVGGAELETSADFAKHALIGARKDPEFSGPGDDTLELTGKLLPFHVGGLSELEYAKQLCTSGQPQYVWRGDGRVNDWYIILKVKEKHSQIGPVGVGYEVQYTISLEKVDDPSSDVGGDLIGAILSLFG